MGGTEGGRNGATEGVCSMRVLEQHSHTRTTMESSQGPGEMIQVTIQRYPTNGEQPDTIQA